MMLSQFGLMLTINPSGISNIAMQYSQLLYVAAGFASVIIFSSSASSQGVGPGQGFNGHDYGANRRVRTGSGYGGVLGTFSEPTAMASDSVMADRKAIPNPYVGGGLSGGSVEVDAGLKYYPFPYGTGATGFPMRPGWFGFVFVNNNSNYVGSENSLFMSNGHRWRASRGQLGSIDVAQWFGTDGSVNINIEADSNSPLPLKLPQVFPVNKGAIEAATMSNMFVKRVTAMTQPAPGSMPGDGSRVQVDTATLDNSYFKGIRWSGGNLAQWIGGTLVWLDPGNPWPAAATDLAQSGIDVAQKDGKGNWIIDFGAPYARAANGDTPVNAARYRDETVHVSLLAPPGRGRLRGRRLKRAKMRF